MALLLFFSAACAPTPERATATSPTTTTTTTAPTTTAAAPSHVPADRDALLDRLGAPDAVSRMRAFLVSETCLSPLATAEATRTMPEDTSVDSVGSVVGNASIEGAGLDKLATLQTWLAKTLPQRPDLHYGRLMKGTTQSGWSGLCFEPSALLEGPDFVARASKTPQKLVVALSSAAKKKLRAAASASRQLVWLLDDDVIGEVPVGEFAKLSDPVATFDRRPR